MATAPPRSNPHDEPDVVALRPRRTAGTRLSEAEVRRELEGQAADREAEAKAAARAARGPEQVVRPLGRRGRGGRGGAGRPSWSGRALGQNTLAPMRVDVDVTGFVLALMFWGWVVLPMLQGGPPAVVDVLRAKFVNRGPDGEWLP